MTCTGLEEDAGCRLGMGCLFSLGQTGFGFRGGGVILGLLPTQVAETLSPP